MKFTLPPETRWAIALTIIIILVTLLATDAAPQWVYQGF
jgi:hypothetical protein